MNFSPLHLADHRAGRVYTLLEPAPPRVALAPVPGVLSEHAGVAQPRPDTALWVDEAAGEIVLESPAERRRIAVATPSEHVAVDPSGTMAVVTPGLGASFEPWNDVATWVDLTTGRSARFRTRVGEPGVGWVIDAATAEPTAVLRHREPGSIEALPAGVLRALGPHVPLLRGAQTLDVAPDGHGDVAHGGIFATATSRGLERFRVLDGQPEAIGVLPWPTDGRAHYLRLSPVPGQALGVLRGGPVDPSRWVEWSNAFAWFDLASCASGSLELPPGLAFRFGVGGDTVAVATLHPEGDRLNVLRRAATTNGPGWRLAGQLGLPPLSGAPLPGHVPWEGVGSAPAQRRSVAVSADGEWIAVTRGGDSEVHLLRATDLGESPVTVRLPTALDEGGIAFFRQDRVAAGQPWSDGIGR